MTGAARPRALALIDGEHYPDVVRAAFASLPYEIAGAVSLGGTEKLRGGEEYGVPLHASLEEGIERALPEVVLDLSDQPVADPRTRFLLASRTLAAGLAYVGADFRFEPVAFAPLDVPALAIIGSGKRVGKTAVSGYVARLLADTRDLVVVAMGRGGPAEPVVVESQPGLQDLIALSRAGSHAASDYLEDAALAGVVTVGCRRCGGGLAGMPFYSNVEDGVRAAAARRPELILLEGSGAAIPPVAARATILVAGARQDPETVAGFLGAYRILLSDLVIVTGAGEPDVEGAELERLRAAIARVSPEVPVVATVLRPRPAEPSAVRSRRVALFSTAPESVHENLRAHLEAEYGAEVVLVSGNLARRSELRRDLESPAASSADAYLVEIKAAAIDVVAEAAAERGVEIVFADNEVQPLPGEPDLDGHVLALADAAAASIEARA